MRQREMTRRRKHRQAVSAFGPNMGGASDPFQLPANANLYVRSNSIVAAGTTALTAGDRTIKVPALRANQVRCLGWFERGVTVEVQGGLALLIDMGLGRYEAVGAPA